MEDHVHFRHTRIIGDIRNLFTVPKSWLKIDRVSSKILKSLQTTHRHGRYYFGRRRENVTYFQAVHPRRPFYILVFGRCGNQFDHSTLRSTVCVHFGINLNRISVECSRPRQQWRLEFSFRPAGTRMTPWPYLKPPNLAHG